VLLPEESTPEEREQALRRVPLKRLGSPEDVVRGVLYLIESDFVTGEVLNVDGGQHLL
jgi:NAD(P)-dependent dehydrogenase (short-subunit alcohol dehydrogenase family)